MLSPVTLNWRATMNVMTVVLNCRKSPHHSDKMSQRAQVSEIAVLRKIGISIYLRTPIIYVDPKLWVCWSWKIAPHLQFSNSGSKSLHMTNLQCMLSFRDLRCFDAISLLSQFAHFCVEHKWTEHSCLWSKNDKYDVYLVGEVRSSLVSMVLSLKDCFAELFS